jgi:hypothetical protein
MTVARRWKAALFGVGVLGLLSAVITGGVRTGSAPASTPTVAVGGGDSCTEWMCGTNHNQVLL